ncbi:MAG: hypothetical protein M3Y93_11070, partial [Pseudomonadota bacterium]|nr:hypothetical protein [Pseudomonadota bacterium]
HDSAEDKTPKAPRPNMTEMLAAFKYLMEGDFCDVVVARVTPATQQDSTMLLSDRETGPRRQLRG